MSSDRPSPLDAADLVILETLQAEGRTTWARLAELIGMTPPSATERVRRLEERGYISGFEARLDAEALGLSTLGFVLIGIGDTQEHEDLLEHMALVPEIQECHVIAGEYDYLLKIRAHSPEGLAELLRDQIRKLPGVARTNTLVVLHTVKETGTLPLPESDEQAG